jgi:hypothetical protein
MVGADDVSVGTLFQHSRLFSEATVRP